MTSTTQSKKFSELISDLVEMWMSWVKYNDITKSESISIKERSLACDKCEELIANEYLIVAQLDKYFEK